MNRLVLILFFVRWSVASDSLQVEDSKSSRLYRGPENPRSDGGRPRSSIILRERPVEAQRYFTGTPKPIWDDDGNDYNYNNKINYHSIECAPGRVCSQTIPMSGEGDYYDSGSETYNPSYNEIDVEIPLRPTFRPRPPPAATSTSTSQPDYTMGLSVASSYGYSSKWPPVTRRPLFIPPSTTTPRPPYPEPDFYAAETVPQPFYNHNKRDRYDPFAYHAQFAAKRPTGKKFQLEAEAPPRPRPQLQQHLTPSFSHYTSSRLSNVGGVAMPNYISYPSKDLYRSSLTWRDKRRPQLDQDHHRLEQKQYVYQGSHVNQPYQRPAPVNRRSGYDYRNDERRHTQTRRTPYFPSSGSINNYENQKWTSSNQHLNQDNGGPKRNYFPTKQNEYESSSVGSGNGDVHRNDYGEGQDSHTKSFIGEGQILNTGYMVADSPLETIPLEDDNQFVYNNHNDDSDEVDRWYEVTVRPKPEPATASPRLPSGTTLKPWTSLDIAKPQWEDKSSNPLQEEKIEVENGETYGTWNKNTLK